MQVLVVEDDEGVAAAVVEALGAHGHVVTHVSRAAEAWTRVRDADLVLLDLGLPDADGLDVLRRIRRIADTPVLVLTARGSERDVVRGLRLGADDYLVKPVRLQELLARVETVTRRARAAEPAASDVVAIDDLRVDLVARRATVADREVPLTAKEFDILTVLARRPGAAVSRQQLLDEVWGDAYLAVSRSLDVHLAALRSKLGRPGLLATIRGFGYRLGD
ncbi:response regulator transcription factor [Pseudonocardia nigra]|uniref:response regulator transcription factor n=1 Tax=Pseudonocardia nigra TaxID=1921578 RepID=UPI0027E23E2F|nr:response regulator transcription factor [Pseudonocardia nigra]